MSMKYILPALAAAHQAVAQSVQSSCSNAATTTIQNAGDASALANCQTFSGSIAIATGTTDNIDLSGQLSRIAGSLVVSDVAGLTSLSSSSLTTITDSFTLDGATQLSTLNFPVLASVDSIQWNALPNLQGLSFTEGVQQATYVSIQNTDIQSLSGINLQVVDTMILANNQFLTEINMQLGNVSTQMTIESNGRDLAVTFPNMIWANNMTVRNASTVEIPSLASVNGSMGFYSCDFDSLAAPNLTSVGSSLSFVSNEQLANLSMPQLTRVNGALNIQNNTVLDDISFPALQQIAGAVNIYGNFSNVELPALNLVRGAFNLQSSDDLTTVCDHFNSIKGANNVIRGRFSCAGRQSNPGGPGNLAAGTNDGDGSGTSNGTATSSGFAVPMMVPAAGTFLGVVAAIFGVF